MSVWLVPEVAGDGVAVCVGLGGRRVERGQQIGDVDAREIQAAMFVPSQDDTVGRGFTAPASPPSALPSAAPSRSVCGVAASCAGPAS